jgi:2'-5' RNA ligase
VALPRFVLVSSVLTPEGPNYRIIEAFPLSA